MPLAAGGTFNFGGMFDAPKSPVEAMQDALVNALGLYLNGEPGRDHATAELQVSPGGGLTIILRGTTTAGRWAVRMLQQEAGLDPPPVAEGTR